MFDLFSALIGLLIGILLTLVIIWIFYYANAFVFSNCAKSTPECKGSDYYSNPGDAIANGAKVDEILFINDENKMFYNRVPKTSSCIPGSNQLVEIRYPQYCLFTVSGDPFEGKQISNSSPLYDITTPGGTVTINTEIDGSCIPNPGSEASAGVPELKWDSSQ